MRRIPIIITVCFLTVWTAAAQHVIVEKTVTDITCENATRATMRFLRSVTILDSHGDQEGLFVCSCSPTSSLTSFKGTVTDTLGRVIMKMRQSDLQRTEYSPYLAIDEYKLYLDYTPPVYPCTITYEWTMSSHDDLIEFPRFCPQTDYDMSVKKASYRLTTPKSMTVCHALQNISQEVSVSDDGKNSQVFMLELNDLAPLKKEPYARPLRERLPMAYFAPEKFNYFGTEGNLRNWNTYGLWEYSLIKGSEALPEDVCQELHQLTDGLATDREKVYALYNRLAETTRYVAILLGVGGQRPAPAASVMKSGFGDCKGLSNYMRGMLKEIGIHSNYTTISTTHHRLLPDFASAGQLNHVILEVPLKDDTLWLECTNPQLPMGYIHRGIAGHDAVEISEEGGRLVRLPAYADSTNLQRSNLRLDVSGDGAADIALSQTSVNQQYENFIPLLKANQKDRHNMLQRIMHIPQADIRQADITEEGASITIDVKVSSRQYANKTSHRLFVPVCPIHQRQNTPIVNDNRQEDIWVGTGFQDDDNITIAIPDGFEVEALPKDVLIIQPFGLFSCTLEATGSEIHIQNRLLMKSGTYDKTLFPKFADFLRTASTAYDQRIVLKKK